MERSASTEAGPGTGAAPDARQPVAAADPGLRTPDQPASPTSWVLPMAVLVVGMFMSILDVTIVNVAIPAIQRDFGVALDDVLWVATAYTLTLGVVVPLSAWLGDRFGLARATSCPCSPSPRARRCAGWPGAWTV